jgi:outer membrane receptor for ferric coprogen and ferric-rhodotorulic acid
MKSSNLLAVFAAWLGFVLGSALHAQTSPSAASASPKAADEPTTLSVFMVSEEKNVGYSSMQTTAGMRTVQELKNVANSISVVNSELIADIGATNLAEISKYFVSGEESQNPNGFQVTVYRGISTASSALRNGWIWYSPQDTYVMERLELLRGPNAFLYGEAALGGGSNQITKRGLFTRDFNRLKVTGGGGGPSSDVTLSNYHLRRAELDFNRVIKRDTLAVRVASVASNGAGWDDNVSSRIRGIYGAVSYRPFRSTQVDVMLERTTTTNVRAQGLFTDQFSYTTRTALTNANGLLYVPATGQLYRANGLVRSGGSGLTIVDQSVVPRGFQVTGPNNTQRDNFNSFSIEVSQKIGRNLNLLFSGNAYQRKTDLYGNPVGAAVYRDLSPLLPSGAVNPNFNRLYTEYQRTDVFSGNTVRDMRISAVYDLRTSWMKQQIVMNLQQHQDTPKAQSGAKFAEYIDPANPSFIGALDSSISLAANATSRATLTNNRFYRRYYLGDGDSGQLTGDMGGRPGVSAWFPDLGGAVGATNATFRRFYTPSVGVGASGSYFNDHLFTLVGVRQDHFNMRTEWGVVQALPGYDWRNNYIPGQTAATPAFYNAKADGSNYGAVLRVNDMLAFSWNHGKSFQISVGDGSGLFTPGQLQTIPRGEGEDASMRLTFLGGRLEVNTTYYKNYQPNARINPAPSVAIQDELTAIFGTGFNRTGQDYQTLNTSGYELEVVANFTRNWRLMLNASTNELALTNRLPQLKGFQAAAKAQNKATPLLDALLLTFPDGVPSAGYTKARGNVLTRYDFAQGALKGFYIGGGANWRQPTFRGNAVLVQGGAAQALWSPSYTVVNLLAGYRTKLFARPISFALNMDNVLNKDYYVSGAANIGKWGVPQNFRFSSVVEF